MAARRPITFGGVAGSVLLVVACTLVSWYGFGHGELADVVMIYLLGVVVAAMRFGYGPSLLTTVLCVLAYDFFFVPPYFSFDVSDLRHLPTFAVMFLVAVIISGLTNRIRDQADAARGGERRTAGLYVISRELATAPTRERLVEAASRHIGEIFDARVAILLPGADGMLEAVRADAGTLAAGEKEWGVAEWAWLHQRPAGLGTETLPSSPAHFVPLKGARGRVGVLALYPASAARVSDPDEQQFLETSAGLVGSALERIQLADEARRARLRIETEQLRNSLLSSVSHDLRTPLAVVTGATSSLLDPEGPRDEATRRELLQTAHEESLRLNRLVRNLLDMTRLEAGALKVQKEAQPLEEVVGAALDRMEDRLRGREIQTNLPAELPMVPFDSALIEQVLINLLENATKYTPAGSPVDVDAHRQGDDVLVTISDRGPGVPQQDAERVFEKFYRANPGEGGGVGLGLTICRGIVAAHGGRIWVDERPGGGASFHFMLPLDSAAGAGPLVPAERPASEAP